MCVRVCVCGGGGSVSDPRFIPFGLGSWYAVHNNRAEFYATKL